MPRLPRHRHRVGVKNMRTKFDGHTAGPWSEDAWVGGDAYDDPDEPFVEIGSVRWSPNKVDVPAAIEQTANAMLIAAAPDLLAELVAARNTFESICIHNNDQERVHELAHKGQLFIDKLIGVEVEK